MSIVYNDRIYRFRGCPECGGDANRCSCAAIAERVALDDASELHNRRMDIIARARSMKGRYHVRRGNVMLCHMLERLGR